MEGNYGPKPSDTLEFEQMLEYSTWINSNDPSAVAKRKANELKQQEYIERYKQEELDYEAFLRDNPEIVQKCKDKAMEQFDGIIERYLREAFEINKFKAYVRNKYK